VKTLSFSTLDMSVNEETGRVTLRVKAPGTPEVIVEMSADECMMLLVELGNTLSSCRGLELKNRVEWTQEYYRRKTDDIREDSTEKLPGDYTEEID